MADQVKPKSSLEALFVAVTSAFISKTIVAPLARVSTLLQGNYELVRQNRMDRPYQGAIECFSRIKDQEGILSFWRGNSIHFPMAIMGQTLNFALKDTVRSVLTRSADDSQATKFAKNILAGSVGGAMSLLVMYPFQLGFVKRTADVLSPEKGMTRQYKGVIDIWTKVVHTDGVRGLYKGMGLALFGVILYRGLYFGLYDSLKRFANTRDAFWKAFALGWAVTLTAGAAAYPISLVQRRQMLTTGGGITYKSSLHAASEIFKKEGFRGFYRGYVFSLVQGLGGAFLLAGYDIIKHNIQ